MFILSSMNHFLCVESDQYQLFREPDINDLYLSGSFIFLNNETVKKIFPDYYDEICQVLKENYYLNDNMWCSKKINHNKVNLIFNDLYEKQLLILKLTNQKPYMREIKLNV